MQTNTSNTLSCSVFGHNLERVSHTQQSAHKLKCKTCHAEVSVSTHGEFDTHPIKNRQLISVLKQHFILKNRSLQRQLSY